ncbi:class I SAM-dependent methyltransferase [Microbacterium sp. EST19A]|uniref:class I SAM-dependent methyltransferase n=1 Tax=Microbacterium sp. EST19A TaxID=2862681 RepID=UPI001CBEBBC4|nr:methyltransferase domain-containing protein [Microbacterium sp. EST19A]
MDDRLRLISDAFDTRAARYDESTMHRSVAAATAAYVDLSEVDVVLDVATGTGLVLREIAARAADLELIGVDISPGMLDVARSHLRQAALIQADASNLPIPSASVDVITCVTALHIIPSVADAAAEWRRVLRPGGRLVTATFRKIDTSGHGAPELTTTDRPYDRDHEPYSSETRLAETFGRHGFTLRRHRDWSDGTDELLIAELVMDAASA